MDNYADFAMHNPYIVQQQQQYQQQYQQKHQQHQQHQQQQQVETQPLEPRKQRKSAAGRSLIRWDFEKDQHLLLCLEYEAAKIGMQLPWDAAVQHIKPGATGQACIQHLAKVRKYRQEKGQEVPPETAKRRSTKKNDTPSKKRKVIEDDDEDGEEDIERPFNGSTNRMVYEPVKKKAPRRSTVPITPDSVIKPAKSARRRSSKVKKEDFPGQNMNKPDAEADYVEELKPQQVSQPKKKRGRSTINAVKKEAVKLEAPILNTRLRMTEDVNYAEPDILEDLEEADGHSDSAYDHQGAYNMGMNHADEEFDEADEYKPTARHDQHKLQTVNNGGNARSTAHDVQSSFHDSGRHGSITGDVTVQSPPQVHTGNKCLPKTMTPLEPFDVGQNHGLGLHWGEGLNPGSDSSLFGVSSCGTDSHGPTTARGNIDNFSGVQTPTHPVHSKLSASFDNSHGHRAQAFGQMQYPAFSQNYVLQRGPQNYGIPNNGFASFHDSEEQLFQPLQVPNKPVTAPSTLAQPQNQHYQFTNMAKSAISPTLVEGQDYQFNNGILQRYQQYYQPSTSPQPQHGMTVHSTSSPNQTATPDLTFGSIDQSQQPEEHHSSQIESSVSARVTNADGQSLNSASPHEDAVQAFDASSPIDNGKEAFKLIFGDGSADVDDFGSFIDFGRVEY